MRPGPSHGSLNFRLTAARIGLVCRARAPVCFRAQAGAEGPAREHPGERLQDRGRRENGAVRPSPERRAIAAQCLRGAPHSSSGVLTWHGSGRGEPSEAPLIHVARPAVTRLGRDVGPAPSLRPDPEKCPASAGTGRYGTVRYPYGTPGVLPPGTDAGAPPGAARSPAGRTPTTLGRDRPTRAGTVPVRYP